MSSGIRRRSASDSAGRCCAGLYNDPARGAIWDFVRNYEARLGVAVSRTSPAKLIPRANEIVSRSSPSAFAGITMTGEKRFLGFSLMLTPLEAPRLPSRDAATGPTGPERQHLLAAKHQRRGRGSAIHGINRRPAADIGPRRADRDGRCVERPQNSSRRSGDQRLSISATPRSRQGYSFVTRYSDGDRRSVDRSSVLLSSVSFLAAVPARQRCSRP